LSADEIESGLEQGRLHLELVLRPPPPRLEAELLFEEELVLIVPTHRLAGQSRVHFELDKEPLILLIQAFALAGLWIKAYKP